jgi:hypothetical protein
MSPRARRRFLLLFFLFLALLFAGGMVAYVLDFRHQKVCVDGKTPLAQQTDELGQVTYLCPGGVTVTQGLVP